MDEDWSDDLSEMVEEWEGGDFDPMEARRGRGRGGKSTRLITLCHKRTFDYSFLAVGSTTVVIKRALNVVPYFYYTLMVRVHNIDILHGASSFVLTAYNTLPSRQDPEEFTAAATGLTLTVDNGNSAGDLLIAKDNDEGAFFKVLLTINQGALSNRLYAELSAALLVRAIG